MTLALTGAAWSVTGAEGRVGGAGAEVRQLADSPLDAPCRGPINGWQDKPPVSCT
ncbi:hypothetical protein [Streptomyces sp. NPDC019224]|uniref:hypothetical protein n=1 Tax=Streptomyces sp. NPDC019224 TaxID=3154484 RepID=UPI003410EACE